MVSGRGLHPKGVELLGFREGATDLGEARDDAAAIAKDGNGAALPVALAGLVRVLQLAEQAVGHLIDALVRVLITQTFDARDEARPGAGLQLIEHRGAVFIDRHGAVSPIW